MFFFLVRYKKDMDYFNWNRMVALLLILISAFSAWSVLILMTNEYTSAWPTPNQSQWTGLGIAVGVAILVWLKQCLTIIPR